MIQGKKVHLIGMPFAFGWTKKGCGDTTNRLTINAGDPNTTIYEAKACCVNIRKADKLTELDINGVTSENEMTGGNHV